MEEKIDEEDEEQSNLQMDIEEFNEELPYSIKNFFRSPTIEDKQTLPKIEAVYILKEPKSEPTEFRSEDKNQHSEIPFYNSAFVPVRNLGMPCDRSFPTFTSFTLMKQ